MKYFMMTTKIIKQNKSLSLLQNLALDEKYLFFCVKQMDSVVYINSWSINI